MKAARQKPHFDSKTFLSKVGDGRTVLNYGKGELVFAQSDPAGAVFFVQKGRVKLTVVSQQGKEAIIAIQGPGDFSGEGCLAGRAHGNRRRAVRVHDRADRETRDESVLLLLVGIEVAHMMTYGRRGRKWRG